MGRLGRFVVTVVLAGTALGLGALALVPVAGVVWVLITAGYRNAMTPTPPVRSWALSRWRRPANLPR